MRRALASWLLVPVIVLLGASTASAYRLDARVVGGTDAALADVPWQALVLPGNRLCGGSILDERHVVTAAHCVYDEPTDLVYPASAVDVVAGVVDLDDLGAGQHLAVTAVTVHPLYDPDTFRYDAAVLTLAEPGLDLSGPVDAIALAAPTTLPAVSADLRLSGWGKTLERDPGTPLGNDPISDLLQVVDIHPATGCEVLSGYDPSVHLCAGQPHHDACQGDSGGPLAELIDGAWRLDGIVSAGAGCAVLPGIYTRVAHPAVHDFLARRGADSTPTNLQPPTLTGTPTPGARLTCLTGTWANARSYTFRIVAGSTTISTSATLDVTAALTGQTLKCLVTAYAIGGAAMQAASAPVAVAAAAAPPPVVPVPAPVVPVPAALQARPLDTAAPSAKVTAARCTRTLCVLDVRVTDAAPSDGIARLEATVRTSYRTTCATDGRRRPCTKTQTRTLRAVRQSAADYRITTPRLRTGTHRFTLAAVDVAGHRQAAPVTLTRTTR